MKKLREKKKIGNPCWKIHYPNMHTYEHKEVFGSHTHQIIQVITMAVQSVAITMGSFTVLLLLQSQIFNQDWHTRWFPKIFKMGLLHKVIANPEIVTSVLSIKHESTAILHCSLILTKECTKGIGLPALSRVCCVSWEVKTGPTNTCALQMPSEYLEPLIYRS